MELDEQNKEAIENIIEGSSAVGMNLSGARVLRTSSRFCFGVEHGDYNGTELFGVGTDRFVWLAYRPSSTQKTRLYSVNFPQDGVIEYRLGNVAAPLTPNIADSWARFPYGVDYILNRRGHRLKTGIDGVVYGNIPGGGMSRSASLTLNLIISMLDANELKVENPLDVVDIARAVENEYIGSPCGELDQVMIMFARADAGVHYKPQTRCIDYVPFRRSGDEFRIVILDTGTVRQGLEKSTYKIRRAECEQLVGLICRAGIKIENLADVKSPDLYDRIVGRLQGQYPNLCERLEYVYYAQQRFYEMLNAWEKGDIATVGRLFNEDGVALRDKYRISGPQLEAMCDIARQVPGVLGARMLGGGDKGAAGALVRTAAVGALTEAVNSQYPRLCPEYADKFSVHICNLADGVQRFDSLLT
jgi:galactokinase